MLKIKEVETSKEISDFFKFPSKLHQNDPNFVPQLYSEENSIFSLKNNDCFSFCDVTRFLIYDNNKVVGRFAFIINNRYNSLNNKKELRFTRFDMIDDKSVFDIFFDKAKEFAISHNLDTIVGPFGFSSMDYNGLLLDNFDTMGTCFSSCCYEYVSKYFLENGFNVDKELYVLYLDISNYDDPRYEKMCKYILDNYGLVIKKPNNDSELVEMIANGIKLTNEINEIYQKDLYFAPYTDKQINSLSLFISELTNYNYTVSIYKDEKLVGFCYASPSLAKALKKSKGRIGPATSIRLHNAFKQNDTVDFPFIAISREFKDINIESVLFFELLKEFKKNGVNKIYTNPIECDKYPINIINGYSFNKYKKIGILKYNIE